MDFAVIEHRVSCPFCWESMTVLIDLSGGAQTYIEDCQVCCQPMQISFDVENGECANLAVARAS